MVKKSIAVDAVMKELGDSHGPYLISGETYKKTYRGLLRMQVKELITIQYMIRAAKIVSYQEGQEYEQENKRPRKK